MEGPPARVETLRWRSHGGGMIHTAASERRHAPCRERRAPLARRCRALARHSRTLPEGLVVGGTVENFGTPQESLSSAPKTPPAMVAGITDHGWTLHARLSCPVPRPRWAPPKRRGRPAQALQRLIARWCP